jgi:DNA helicase-2/ATP-dependent DNA helicase PcrA
MSDLTNIEELVRDENLTPEQAQAVVDNGRAILCIACAGSGKSQTLAYRIARLVSQGVSAESIVAITFTEKAADSIKRRIASVLIGTGQSPNLIGQMFIGTIHAFCQNVLADSDAVFRQYDVLDANRFMLYLMSRYYNLGIAELRGRYKDKYFETLEQVRNAWNILRDEGMSIDDVQARDEQLGTTLAAIRDGLVQDQFIDFASMVREVADRVRIAGRVRERLGAVRHLLVDEYQDVSGAQEELITAIHQLGGSIFVVGDDDQSIYGWRGAYVANILEFEQRYTDVHRHILATNFRSTRAIVDASNAFAASQLGPQRLPKVPRPYADASPRQLIVHHFPTRQDEAEWVADRIFALIGTAYRRNSSSPSRGLTAADFAVLMRSTKSEEQDGNPRHAAFSNALRARGIDFTLSAGGSVFDRPAVNALREVFSALEQGAIDRTQADSLIAQHVRPAYPRINVRRTYDVLADWGRRIHQPAGAVRQRLFPQALLIDLLEAFDLANSGFDEDVMRDIGLFSRMLQDIESVYLSVDSTQRFRSVVRFLQQIAERGYDVSTDDVITRPNAVTVSTVHQVKGLEFPVVFVVDVVPGRFPTRQMAFECALPDDLMAPALQRGAYGNSVAAEARLFYTALTRAERFLHVTGAVLLPNGKQRKRQSPFAAALRDDELCDSPDRMPEGLAAAPPRQEVDEATLPTSFSDIKYYLSCPMDYRFRKSFGFSPPVPELFGYGRVVHVTIEKLHEIFRDRAPTQAEASDIAEQNFHLKHIAPSRDPENRPGAYEQAKSKACQIAREYVDEYAVDFAQQRQVEVRFEIPARGCLITGAIDLLMRCNDAGEIVEAHVLDFKTMEGGADPLNNEQLEWRELSLQVQLYAKAAREVFGENAATGSIHLLKDNQRIEVPIDAESIRAAVENVEWAVKGILEQDFPMRPSAKKCEECDFNRLCAQRMEQFRVNADTPPPIMTPAGPSVAAAINVVA